MDADTNPLPSGSGDGAVGAPSKNTDGGRVRGRGMPLPPTRATLQADDRLDRLRSERESSAHQHFASLDKDQQQALLERYNAQQAIAVLRVGERHTPANQAAFGRWLANDLWGELTTLGLEPLERAGNAQAAAQAAALPAHDDTAAQSQSAWPSPRGNKEQRRRQAVAAAAKAGSVVERPWYSAEVRGLPSALLRSAFFTAINLRAGKKRVELKKSQVFAQKGLRIVYTGDVLDQGDRRVFGAVVHVCQHAPENTPCAIKASDLLALMDQRAGGEELRVLEERLFRLKRGTVEIHVAGEEGGWQFVGSLIGDYSRDDRRGYVLRLGYIGQLFRMTRYTFLDRQVMRKLAGHPLASWLYGYYSTHARPFHISIAWLYRCSGCKVEGDNVGEWAKTLRRALQKLADTCDCIGERRFTYAVVDGKVRVAWVDKRQAVRETLGELGLANAL